MPAAIRLSGKGPTPEHVGPGVARDVDTEQEQRGRDHDGAADDDAHRRFVGDGNHHQSERKTERDANVRPRHRASVCVAPVDEQVPSGQDQRRQDHRPG